MSDDDPRSAIDDDQDINEDEVPASGLPNFRPGTWVVSDDDSRSAAGDDQDINEDENPKPGLSKFQLPQPKDFHERMQGRLITSFVGLLVLTLLLGAAGWLFSDGDLRDWVSFTTPIFTLSGSALAYYFGRDDRKK